MKRIVNVLGIMLLIHSLCFILPGYAKGTETDPYCDGIPEELVLAQPEKMKKTCTLLYGYYKITDDGIAVYYSAQDYLYETKENAIWLPEREDYSIDDLLRDGYSIEEGKSDNGIYAVIQGKGDTEYGAVATYLKINDWENDPIYRQVKTPELQREKRYDEKEKEKEPITVSYYRLQGDPWPYDGKKVKVEVVYEQMEAGKEAANYDIVNIRGLREINSVNGIQSWDDYYKAWETLIKEYQPYAENVAEGIYGIGIRGINAHVWLTCMYYIYAEEYQNETFIGYRSLFPGRYVSQKIEIHEKDVPRAIKALKEIEKNEENIQ